MTKYGTLSTTSRGRTGTTAVVNKSDDLSQPRYENLATAAGTKISTVMRNVLTDGKDVVITQPDPKRQEDRARVMRILGNAGNNLNQIARHLNILSKQGDLRYSEVVHYLYLLENIEAQFNVTLQIYNHADPG